MSHRVAQRPRLGRAGQHRVMGFVGDCVQTEVTDATDVKTRHAVTFVESVRALFRGTIVADRQGFLFGSVLKGAEHELGGKHAAAFTVDVMSALDA